jgi:hypothetical protein
LSGTFSAQYVVQSAAEVGFETQYLGLDPKEQDSLPTIIEDFGARVENIWKDLRATTRNLVEKAWRTTPGGAVALPRTQAAPYDARADSELSGLVVALDEQAKEGIGPAGEERSRKARSMADTCASLLMEQTQSAEIFAKLILRAHAHQDFARIDKIADALAKRLAPSEVCELARSNSVVVRALAQEVLTQAPASTLAALSRDPVDASEARLALLRQAQEYGSDTARRVLNELDQEEFGLGEF